MMTIIENGGHFELEFPYLPAVVREVKGIRGARWIAGAKHWIIPLSERGEVEKLRRKYAPKIKQQPEQYDIVPGMPELSPEHIERLDQLLCRPDGSRWHPKGYKPFPYQLRGVARGHQLKRFINGDQPGLGKTVQSIMTLLLTDAFPVLIICPSSLKLNWQREWKMWTGMNALILSDSIKGTWQHYYQTGMCKVFITNFESLKKYFVQEIKKPRPDAALRINHIHFRDSINIFKTVIIDESHRVKDPGTQQAKFTFGIAKGKEYILALTGTPVVNKPRDLASQLYIINQIDPFGNWKAFIDRYCDGYNGASNLRELQYMLYKHCFYRREKKEVLSELPDKMRQIILCDISTRKEYAEALIDLENYLKKYRQATDEQAAKSMRGEIMVRIGILKNISARGKLADVCDQIQEVITQGEKIVVFVHLHEVADELKKQFPEAVSVLGTDSTEHRQGSIDRFQKDPDCKLIICSIKAAGVGITLTASSRVAFVELPWHPADCDQCEDRCHRIGQTDSVQCMYFLGKDTIDEDIYKIIDKKRIIADTITGATDNIQEEVIDMMMGSLFNRKAEAA